MKSLTNLLLLTAISFSGAHALAYGAGTSPIYCTANGASSGVPNTAELCNFWATGEAESSLFNKNCDRAMEDAQYRLQLTLIDCAQRGYHCDPSTAIYSPAKYQPKISSWKYGNFPAKCMVIVTILGRK